MKVRSYKFGFQWLLLVCDFFAIGKEVNCTDTTHTANSSLDVEKNIDFEQETPYFTIEEELKYARRYEEGYDLYDLHYEAWLQVNHPEAANTIASHSNNPIELEGPLSSSLPIPNRSSSDSIQSKSSHAVSIPVSKVPAPYFIVEEELKYARRYMICMIRIMRLG